MKTGLRKTTASLIFLHYRSSNLEPVTSFFKIIGRVGTHLKHCTYCQMWRCNRCLNGKLIITKRRTRAMKTRSTALSKAEGHIWRGMSLGRVFLDNISQAIVMKRGISCCNAKTPYRDLRKGNGRTQVIYLKLSVSDNDVMLSSTSRPASMWDEGMSRTDTRLWLCPEIRRGSAINVLYYISASPLSCVAKDTICNPWNKECLFCFRATYVLTFTHEDITIAYETCVQKKMIGEWRPNQSEEEGGGVLTYLRPKLCAEVSL